MVRPILNFVIIGSMSIVAVIIIVLAGVRDASMPGKKFNCRMLIGSWHPDVPKEVIEACRKGAST